MRSLIALVAIASLAAGASFAQYDAKQPASPPAAQSKPTTPPTTAKAGAAVTETQAKSQIEAQGFTNVSQLQKDAKGEWTAKAMKDGKSVDLSLDIQGHITPHN